MIHRDLKPSNILVSGEAEIKILDFGLARITEGDMAAATLTTEVGVIKGTLPYMSPEQARGNPAEIDLRADVYALGVILYEAMTGRPVNCVVVGDGPSRDKLVNSANAGPSGCKLIFAGARTDVPDVMRSMDVFVSTSSTEGLPNAVMEAMAAGLPVVATDVGGTAEVVKENTTGFLVPPRDVNLLSSRVESLLADESSRKRLGAAGRKRIEDNFSVVSMVEAL